MVVLSSLGVDVYTQTRREPAVLTMLDDLTRPEAMQAILEDLGLMPAAIYNPALRSALGRAVLRTIQTAQDSSMLIAVPDASSHVATPPTASSKTRDHEDNLQVILSPSVILSPKSALLQNLHVIRRFFRVLEIIYRSSEEPDHGIHLLPGCRSEAETQRRGRRQRTKRWKI